MENTRSEFRYEIHLSEVRDLPSLANCCGCGYAALFKSVDQTMFFQTLGGMQYRREKFKLDSIKRGFPVDEVPSSLVELKLTLFCRKCCPKMDQTEPMYSSVGLKFASEELERRKM